MRALIFNSGLGSRLGRLTAHGPKCLVRLPSGETILHRQLRLLSLCGVRDFVVTTGPFAELVEAECRPFADTGCTFRFVRNERYTETNYIWSMWLAREHLTIGDTILMHGDLVFDAGWVRRLLNAPEGSWGPVNAKLPLPEKDFKARVADGEIREVGVDVWGEDCLAFQAMYRLSPESTATWLSAIERFVQSGRTGVYAENAANEVFEAMHVRALSYEDHLLEEVDTLEDLERVGGLAERFDYAAQPVIELDTVGRRLLAGSWVASEALPTDITSILNAYGAANPLVIADLFFASDVGAVLGRAFEEVPVYSNFGPNPTIEQVDEALAAFRANECDSLVSVGGGSAMDIAKCVRLWATGDDAMSYLHGIPSYTNVVHIAVPTTAGTGAESTHFAVVYENGTKRSVMHPLAQPDVAVLMPDLLSALPPYQRASTMLDAVCQAIESHWSRASGKESRRYSSEALLIARGCWEAYLAGDGTATGLMAHAANLAGKAINLTTTTAPHAMSYKLTSLFGVAHGHAVALCMPPCWEALLKQGDSRTRFLLRELDELLSANEDCSDGAGLRWFHNLFARTELDANIAGTESDLDVLCSSVNTERLDNFPLELTQHDLRDMYGRIVRS